MQTETTLVATLQEAFTLFRHRMMGLMYTFIRDRGLTMGQFGAMMHIFQKDGCGVSDVGTDLGITNSAASQMLDRLVQLDLITRSEDPTDRRSKQIVLTEKGMQIVQDVSTANRKWLDSLAQAMTTEEQDLVKKAMVVLIEKARQVDANSG